MGEVASTVTGAFDSFMGNDRSAPGAPDMGYDPAEVKRLKEERKAALDKMSGATPIKDENGKVIGYSGDTYESRALNNSITGHELYAKNNELIQRQQGMLPQTDSAGRPIVGIDPVTGANITTPGYGDIMQEGQNLRTKFTQQGVDAGKVVSDADLEYSGMRRGLTGPEPDSITSRRGAYEDKFGTFADEAGQIAGDQKTLSDEEAERIRGFSAGYGGLRDELGTAKSQLAGTTGSIEQLQQESQASREALGAVGKKFSNLESQILGGTDKTGLFAGELEAQRSGQEEGQRERLRRAAAQSGDVNATRALMKAEDDIGRGSAEAARRDILTANIKGAEEGRSELQKTSALADLYEREKSTELAKNQILNQMLGQTQAKQQTAMQGASLTSQDANLLQQQGLNEAQRYNVLQQGQQFRNQGLNQQAQFTQTGAGFVNQDEATRLNEANIMNQQLANQRYGLDANRQNLMDQNMMTNQQLGYLNNMRGALAGVSGQNAQQLGALGSIQNLENAAANYGQMPLQTIQGDLDNQTQAKMGQANLSYQSDMAEYNKPTGFDQALQVASVASKFMPG